MITCLLKGLIGTGKPDGDRMKLTKSTSPCQTRQMVNTFQKLDLLSSIHSKNRELNSFPDCASLTFFVPLSLHLHTLTFFLLYLIAPCK